jgi:hypothetical protein
MPAERTAMRHVREVLRLKAAGVSGNRSPDQLTEEEVRRYLLEARERNARGTFKTCHYGIPFFYRTTLGQDWPLFKKRSGFPSRSGCRRRFPMPKWGASSPRSAIRYTAAVSA